MMYFVLKLITIYCPITGATKLSETSLFLKLLFSSLFSAIVVRARDIVRVIIHTELYNCCRDIVSYSCYIVPTLQRCVVLKMVVVNRPVKHHLKLIKQFVLRAL